MARASKHASSSSSSVSCLPFLFRGRSPTSPSFFHPPPQTQTPFPPYSAAYRANSLASVHPSRASLLLFLRRAAAAAACGGVRRRPFQSTCPLTVPPFVVVPAGALHAHKEEEEGANLSHFASVQTDNLPPPHPPTPTTRRGRPAAAAAAADTD